MERQQERARDNARYWANFALDANESVASVIGMIGESAGSDIRLKERIDPVGVSPSGLKIYEFSYLGTPERYQGVMAQDLIYSHPEALMINADGFYLVDYALLDVDFVPVAREAS